MKKLSTILISLLALATSVNANNSPIPVISTSVVTVIAIDEATSQLFESAEYNISSESLVFETKENINVIQIFKGSVMQYQLPVMSKKVTINKNLFDSGEYRLGFIVEGKIKANYTMINIK